MADIFGSAVSDSSGQPGQDTRSFAHARVRHIYSTFDASTATTSDTMVIGYVKSTDLILDIKLCTDGAASAGALNVGLHTVDFRNGSTTLTVSDADRFASAQSVTSAIAFDAAGSVFDESGTLDDVIDRGKAVYALAGLSDDDGETYAITASPSTTIDAATELGFLVTYVAGD